MARNGVDLDTELNRFEPFLKLSLVLLGRFMNLCEGVPKRLFVDDDIVPSTYIDSLGFIDYRFDGFDCVITAKAVPPAG